MNLLKRFRRTLAAALLASSGLALLATEEARAHDTTGICEENFDSNFAIENSAGNYRLGFMTWSKLDENGDVTYCPYPERPGIDANDNPDSIIDWDDIGYQSNCWFWRHLCGNSYIRLEEDAGEGHTWFEEWGVPPTATSLASATCNPGDGFGGGFVAAGSGFATPNCQDWTEGNLYSVHSHAASTSLVLWVEHFQTHEPVIFDLEQLQVHPRRNLEGVLEPAPAEIALKVGPGENDWFCQPELPSNAEISPGVFEVWDVSDWGFEVERAILRSATSVQTAFGKIVYRTPSFSGWGTVDICGNDACSSTEECATCPQDCACPPVEVNLPANSTAACTGAAACTLESWGIDLNADTGYGWNVDGGANGGTANLFFRVAAFTGTRSMGIQVNGTQFGIITANSTDSPRPEGDEFGPFFVPLNAGNNVVALVDNQGTVELDAHYLRAEISLDPGEADNSDGGDCGDAGVPQNLLLAQSTAGCTGQGNCTVESWGVDLNANTGYQWSVSGGSTGGGASLFVKVATLSGTRSMGLSVNGSQVAVITANSNQSPRPTGSEFGPFTVSLNSGNNVVALVDNQGTLEFDVHQLRVVPMIIGHGACDAFCSNGQTISWSGSYQGGNLGTGALCLETAQPVAGGNCGNFASGRKLFMNGTEMPCDAGNWPSLPPTVSDGYCIQTTAGDHPWAFLTLW